MAMGKYTSQVLVDNGGVDASSVGGIKTGVAIAAVTLITCVHLLNVKVVSRFQLFFTGLKIVLIVVLIGCGFLLGSPQDVDFSPSAAAFDLMLTAPFAISLVFVMYAYSGWNAATYIAGEIHRPGRNLPLSLFLGTLLVMLLYVPLNGVFLYSTPIDALAGNVEVGYIAANHIFGDVGGTAMGLLISLGLISAISSMVWAGPRVTQVMGEDFRILRFLSHRNKNNAPTYALLFQFAIVLLLILTAQFEAVIYYIGFILSLSSFLTVLGVFVLRFKQPNLERPYKTWGYPVTPLFYLIITGWMLYYVVDERPEESLAGLATLLVGCVLYFIDKMIGRREKRE